MTTSPIHPGSGSNPLEVGYHTFAGKHVVTLAIGDGPDRDGWYGTPDQAEALAAALTQQANLVRNASEGEPR